MMKAYDLGIVYLAWVGGSCVVRRGSCVVGRASWVVRRGSCVSNSCLLTGEAIFFLAKPNLSLLRMHDFISCEIFRIFRS